MAWVVTTLMHIYCCFSGHCNTQEYLQSIYTLEVGVALSQSPVWVKYRWVPFNLNNGQNELKGNSEKRWGNLKLAKIEGIFAWYYFSDEAGGTCIGLFGQVCLPSQANVEKDTSVASLRHPQIRTSQKRLQCRVRLCPPPGHLHQRKPMFCEKDHHRKYFTWKSHFAFWTKLCFCALIQIKGADWDKRPRNRPPPLYRRPQVRRLRVTTLLQVPPASCQVKILQMKRISD